MSSSYSCTTSYKGLQSDLTPLPASTVPQVDIPATSASNRPPIASNLVTEPDSTMSFHFTCKNINIQHQSDGWYLHADVKAGEVGLFTKSDVFNNNQSLRLEDHIGYFQGQLVYFSDSRNAQGGFGTHVTPNCILVDGHSLHAQAIDTGAQLSIDLDAHITNDNGNLRWVNA